MICWQLQICTELHLVLQDQSTISKQADYKIDIELDDKNQKLFGKETITYTNNAKEALDYIWVQLDQNQQAKNSKTPLVQNTKTEPAIPASAFQEDFWRKILMVDLR
jgi:hypothetical protein